jgi:small-conductance mechanosensitive channel
MNEKFREFIYEIVFTYKGYDLFVYNLLELGFVLLAALAVQQFMRRALLPRLLNEELNAHLTAKERMRTKRWTWLLFWSLLALGILGSLELDNTLFKTNKIELTVRFVIKWLALIQFVRVLDWYIVRVFMSRFVIQRKESELDERDRQTIDKEGQSVYKGTQYILYLLLAIFMLRQLEIDFTLFSTDIHGNGIPSNVNISHFLAAILVFFVIRVAVWAITNIFLYAYYQRSSVDVGGRFAVNQLVSYVLYTFGFIITLRVLGINVTLLLGGAAALLVGIGLGLQQLFNDLISGIIILFDRTVEVNDVVEINGMVGRVRRIGIRASLVETRDNVSVVVPNSKFMSENVINWSHEDVKVRFFVKVGVAYGSDLPLVRELLIRAAKGHPQVMRSPEPFVRLCDFGSSSIDMELFFWSNNGFRVENVKSDIRFEIDRLFRENKVTIPFPQVDVWMQRP